MKTMLGLSLGLLVTLASLTGHADTLTWTGLAGDGLASTAGNWDPDTRAPLSGDDIVLDGTSSSNLTWDDAAVDTVASWTQTPDYTGTVTIETTYPDYQGSTFTNLTIQGDCVLSNGVWTHKTNPTTVNTLEDQQYRLQVTVGQDLTIGALAEINVSGVGFAAKKGPGASVGAQWAGSHGGKGDSRPQDDSGPCYGSITAPTTLGSGGNVDRGGGAVILVVSGTLRNDGLICANGVDDVERNPGAGGSVYLTAGALTGGSGGMIQANGGTPDFYPGGGGRVALVITNASADFSAYGGSVEALAGDARAAPGTVYLQTAAQGDHGGTLIVDNKGNSSYSTDINAGVTDTRVGNILIRDAAHLRLANQILTVSGVWSNAATATFTAETGGEVIFADAGITSTIYGNNAFMRLTSTEAGKEIKFEKNSTTTILAGGRLRLRGGGVGDELVLRSTETDTPWNLSVDPLAEQNIDFVDVRDSDASGGELVRAVNSVGADPGLNNVNWKFKDRDPGDTVQWTGNLSSTWSTSSNWVPDRVPMETDVVIIPDVLTNDPVLDDPRTVNQLQVQSGAALTLNSYDLTVTNNAAIVGALVAAATETITFEGDADFTGGTFTPALSTVALAGDAAQAFQPADLTFANVTVLNDSATVTFAGGLTAAELRCEAPTGARALTFQEGAEYHLSNLILEGATGETNITLRSTTGGQPWYLNVSGYRSVRGVDVADSNADGGVTIFAINSLDSIGNSNWNFDAVIATWQGTIDADFHNADNWDPAVVPDEDALVLVDTDQAMTISQAVTVQEFTVGGGELSASVTVNAPLTVGVNLMILENGTLAFNRPSVVGNNVVVLSGGLLTHSPNTNQEINKLNLTVMGDLEVRLGGVVDVTGMGYSVSPVTMGLGGFGTQIAGSYGGRGHGRGGETQYSPPCYGSVVAPTNFGSASHGADAGGGAIIMNVAGTIRNDGLIKSEPADAALQSGAGGSVFLTSGNLNGTGVIRARGALGAHTYKGGGGRISLVLTNATASFDNYTGSVEAYAISGPGTIYRQTAADGDGRGVMTVDNNGTKPAGVSDYQVTPAAELPSAPALPGFFAGELDRVTVRVANAGHLRLRDDFTVGDIWLDTADVDLVLDGYTLYVNTPEHDLGAGRDKVDFPEDIQWLEVTPGTLIMVR